MVKKLLIALVLSMMIIPLAQAQKPKKQMYTPNTPVTPKYVPDNRIDNMSYWRRMASMGLVPVQQTMPLPAAEYGTSKLVGKSISTDDSPDVPVTTQNSTQSENSIFVHPTNPQALLQSNNSTQNPVGNLYGANSFLSSDAGTTWGGTVQGAGGTNSGDPTTCIGLNGRYYVGYIHINGGQGVSYSDDQGVTWTPVLVADAPGGWGSLLDKNHMWIDNSPISPYEGNLYDAWTNFGGSNDSEIEISRSTNDGVSWSTPVNISSAINAGSHNQGVNIQTGPNGEVYAIWAIYDSWPQDEKAIGMAKSLDGGATWLPATRIISNIRGIRNSETGKNMRVNAFPTMAVDISNSVNSGTIYVTWPNIGVPGINTGNDMDIYMIKSSDGGETWSTPIRVNQDPAGLGKEHYFPWITCDPINGNLSVVYYDDRNVNSNQCEVYTSNSTDGGATWEDLKVSDVSFTPSPIPGLAGGYMGDYLGNHARDRWVYPVWTDNRSGITMTYVSPFQTGPPPNQPWIVYAGSSLNDAEGNGNGLLDFGESTNINVSLENEGDTPATDVVATLATENPFITIVTSEALFGNMAIGEIVEKTDAYAIQVAENIPDGEKVTFTLTITDANDSTFVSNFILEAHAPAFSSGAATLTEITGNGNNRLDAGETAELTIPTINIGDYETSDITGTLTSTSPFITITNPTQTWETLLPGTINQVLPVFEISVSPEAPVGHLAIFNYTISNANAQFTKEYKYPVGLILEDWETGDFTNFEWQFAGGANWTIVSNNVYEGEYAAKSGVISDNGSTELKLQYDVMASDSISFYVKVSSESNYDWLKFYINNEMIAQWSGTQDWTRVAFPVAEGIQNFRWVYTKDVSVSNGDDAGYLDYIVLPAERTTVAFAGQDGATCGSTSYMLSGIASNYVTSQWTTSGDGTFDDVASLNAFYTPGTNDITAGSVVLTLTVDGPEGEVKSDNMTLTISTPAEASALENFETCVGSIVSLEAVATNYSELSWTSSGTGIFTEPGSLMTMYEPSEEDYNSGSVTLSLEVISGAPCENIQLSSTITFLPKPTIELSLTEAEICQGEQVTAQVSFTGEGPWTFEMDNGVGTIETSENPYTIALIPTVTTAYHFTFLADANCFNMLSDSIVVNVKQAPVISLATDTTLCAGTSLTLDATASGDVTYLWNPGGQISSSITVDTTGIGIGTNNFSVTVTDNTTNCSTSATSSVTFEDCTGFGEVNSNLLSIYPNPSKGSFNLRLNIKDNKSYTLEIYDLNNKMVYSQPNVAVRAASTFAVHKAQLADGVYTVYLKNGHDVYMTKLVIRK